jgi:hypothetical protein
LVGRYGILGATRGLACSLVYIILYVKKEVSLGSGREEKRREGGKGGGKSELLR